MTKSWRSKLQQPPVDLEVNLGDDHLLWVKDGIAGDLRYMVVATIMFGAD
jgi:hypothetical protein